MAKKELEEGLDPVFAAYGQKVYTYAYVEKLRRENLELKRHGKRSYNLIPQAGFQERVLTSDADIKIVGGKRGGGKTWVALFQALEYMDNPDVSMYGFRKLEDDVKRGIWKSSKQVFRGFANATESSFEWSFNRGQGATMRMEHLQDPKKVSDRFRGVEMAYIVIEELAEHTRESMNVLFDLLASNRSTAGVRPRCVCTCNPVGKSNRLRMFLDWWIDPETDTVIPERDGKIRYFFRFGNDDKEIIWGDSPEDVFNDATAHSRIQKLCDETGLNYTDFITSLTFIEGDFRENEILQVADPKYMSRVTARGGESTVNDVAGIWRDIDSGTDILNMTDMDNFFNNTECLDDKIMRASCDVALTGDFFVIWAACGHHIVDMDAWIGMPSDDVVPFVRNFLKKNGIREENFTYDANGLGLWLKDPLPDAIGFNNKSAASDPRLWNNLKSESAEKFAKEFKMQKWSIDSRILERRYTDSKGNEFSVKDRLIDERRAIKRKDTSDGRFEIISKQQMKLEVGHSPDFIEGMFMLMPLFEKGNEDEMIRDGWDYL